MRIMLHKIYLFTTEKQLRPRVTRYKEVIRDNDEMSSKFFKLIYIKRLLNGS